MLSLAGNDPIDPPIPRSSTGLGRSKTTLNVPADARERITRLQPGGPPDEGSAPPSAGVARASSTGGRSPGAGMAGPVRGLSISRKAPAPEERRPAVPEKGEFYCYYLWK